MTDEKKNYVLMGWIDPDMIVQNIPILKNATNFVSHHVTLLGWQMKPVPLQKKISRFVILRDPYERWLGAFTEDLKGYINSRDTLDERQYLTDLFYENNFGWFLNFLIDRDVLYFDTHAQLQIKQLELALEVLGKDNITFIKMTDKLGYVLNHWLHTEGCRNNFNNEKINATDKNNDPIYNTISNYLMDGKNFKKKEKVLEYLKPDYTLFNSVNFINPT